MFVKYFHKLTREEFSDSAKHKAGMTWDEFKLDYPQPAWCNYPNAVAGILGCWSLLTFRVTGRDFCKGCDYYIESG